MIVWHPKASATTRVYDVDWTALLAGDVIASSSVTVASGDAVVASQEAKTLPDGSVVVRAFISGGTSGTTSVFDVGVITATGQDLALQASLLVDDAVALEPATTTKRAVIEMAYEELALAGYAFDQTPDELFTALRRLDALMAMWEGPGVGIDLGYNAPAIIGGGDLDEASGIPDWALQPVVISLALRIMPTIGKTMSAETRAALAAGMQALRNGGTRIPERALPVNTAWGSGNRRWRFG